MKINRKFFIRWPLFLVLLGSSLPFQAVGAVELAKINGRSLSDKDLQSALSGLNMGQQKNILKDKNSRREILNNLIDQEVVAQAGEKEKVDQSQEYKVAIEQFRKQFIANYLFSRDVDTQLTEKSVKKYYENHKYRYTTDQVHVQHILLEDEGAAREMLKKAKAPEADFQALAEQYSRDPSAKNNRGDLAYININSPYVDEFKDAAFSGQAGEIIGPLKTLYGYHILKVVDKKIGKPVAFEEVELRVKNELQRALRLSYIQKLRNAAIILVDDKALDKF